MLTPGFLQFRRTGFSPRWLPWLRRAGSRAPTSGVAPGRLWSAGSAAVVHGLLCPVASWHSLGSPLTRDQTCVPYIGRQIHNHWTTREVPSVLSIHLLSSRNIFTIGHTVSATR